MSYKIVSTSLLVLIASTLLIILAFKVKTVTSAAVPGQPPVAAKGCCVSSSGGCGAVRQNQGKGY